MSQNNSSPSAVYENDHPTHVTVFEIYADENAYRAHIQTPHFLKYKNTVQHLLRHGGNYFFQFAAAFGTMSPDAILPTIYDERFSGDKTCVVAAEKTNGAGDVFGFAEALDGLLAPGSLFHFIGLGEEVTFDIEVQMAKQA